jgi:hypothetical protein
MIGTPVRDLSDPGLLRLMQELQVDTKTHILAYIRKLPDPARTELTTFISQYSDEEIALPLRFSIALASGLGISEQDTLKKISRATILGSWHSDLLDDIVDTRGTQSPVRNTYLAHIVFNLYLSSWQEIRGGSTSPIDRKVFCDTELETYTALFDEAFNHMDVARPYRSTRIIAQKCSPVKTIAWQILSLADRSDLKRDIDWLIEKGSFAALLSDDILDWEEDYDALRFTYPIQRILDALEITYQKEDHEEIKLRIFRALYFGTIYHEFMREITNAFAECARVAEPVSKDLSYWFNYCHVRSLASWSKYIEFIVLAQNRLRESDLATQSSEQE